MNGPQVFEASPFLREGDVTNGEGTHIRKVQNSRERERERIESRERERERESPRQHNVSRPVSAVQPQQVVSAAGWFFKVLS